jgi:hypothetical protein
MRTFGMARWLALALVAVAWGLPLNADAAPAAATARIEGFVSSSDATSITVALRNNDQVRVTATPDTQIILRTPAQLTAIKPNDFVAVTSRREPDGALTALLINILPPEYKGRMREVQFVMDTGNMMTNAVVFQNVRKIEGRTLYLRMPDGPSVINVPAMTDVFRLAVVKLTDLKPGMRIVVRGASNPDGSLVAVGITADALPK